MAVVKKIVGLIAIAALSYYAPGWGQALAAKIGLTGAAAGFLGAAIGASIVVAGTFAINAVLMGSRNAPDMEAGKVNVRIPDPPRWLNCGRARQGGGALFGEFDSQGRWWMLIVHSDEILQTGLPYQYYLDDIPVTLDGLGYVREADFRLKDNKDKDPAEVDGEGKGYIRIWTTTYSETDPTPPRISALDAAFPTKWTADHRLVGTTFSVMCMDALAIEHRYKIYRWRGPFGLGEPGLSIVGDWANVYDPRDPAQVLGDRTTYKPTRNAALVWAWFRTHPFGRGKAESSINWDRIAEQADICDEDVEGIEGTQKRYEAGVAIVDSKRRVDAETEILMAMDGQIVFDEDGKSWVRVGHWEAPTLSFSRNRDIMTLSSMEAQDGESETQGVIVKYMEPDANYTSQPSAAWINPLYYDPLTTPKFLTVEILACQNHNQAMRLAKGIGMRSQPRHKIVPIVNLRGLRARHERIITVNYDNTFAGDYEIATPVELDGAGIFTSMGAVPISPTRWTLLAGEEQPKPVVDGSGGTLSFPAITGENVYLSEGLIKIDFPTIPRADATYVGEYILTSDITGDENDPWMPMAVNVDTAVSGLLQEGVSYTVRYRYVTASGRGPAWEYAVISTVAVLPPSTNVTATDNTTSAVVAWKNPNDLRFFSTDVWRGTSADFGAATKIIDNYGGGVGQVQSITDSVAAGPWNYWVVATDGGALEADPVGPVSVSVGVFDYSTGTMAAGSTLTRSSAGSYRNSSGTWTSAAADVARFTYRYSGSAWQLGGLLVEPAATNGLLYSQDLTNAAWGKVGVTTPTATRMQDDTSTGSHYVQQSYNYTSGVTYCLSVEASTVAGSGNRFLTLFFPSAAFGANSYAKFDLSAGTVTYTSAGVTAGMTNLGGAWRCWISATATATVAATAQIRMYNTSGSSLASYTGDGASGLNLDNRQIEVGTKPTSWIATTSATVSRSADVVTLDWAGRNVPNGTINVRYTFDDDTTQTVSTTVASGTSTVPTNLNRSTIKRIEKI